jgi:esterase/lipase
MRPRRSVDAVTSLFLAIGAGLGVSVPALSQPVHTYNAAVALVARRQAGDDSIADPGARSILLTHGERRKRAVVLLHGFTDSPRQFEALAHILYTDGDNVYVPRLPRHGVLGGDARTLAPLTQKELRDCADSTIDIAAELGDSVIVVGLSLGGTMAAWVAQHREVRRSVLIAPALEAGRIPSLLERPILGLTDHLPNITRRAPGEPARPDREPGFSTHALAEILGLGRSVLAEAARQRPRSSTMIVLVNANDRTIKGSAAEALAQRWADHGAGVTLYEIPDSLRLPHNIVDPFRGVGGGAAVLQLLRELSHGESPSKIVRRRPLR